MSVEAITWALKQDVQQSSAKFVLVVLANCTSGDGNVAFPSIPYLAESTSQDRKTVVANLRRLCESGLISDTGKRVGQTKQVVVYRLNIDGMCEEKRNSSENGTVPKTDGKSTVSPSEQYRFSREESQKRDTEPSLTVKSNRKSKRKEAPAVAVALPEWISPELWQDWVEHRATMRKPLTQRAAELSINTLAELRDQGHNPKAIIENSIVNGWQGLFAPKASLPARSGATSPKQGNRQQQLEDRNQRAVEQWLANG